MTANKAHTPEHLAKQRTAYTYLKDKHTKFIVYGGAAGGGKSWLGCEWLLMCCHHVPGSRWFVGRNNLTDTRESVVITFKKVAAHHGYTAYSTGTHGISFANGSEILFLDLTFYPQKDPLFERLGSKEYTGGWIEEAGEVNEAAFDVLKTRVGRHLNVEQSLTPKILITCNPKKNWLYKDFYRPWKAQALGKDKAFIPALATDNTFLSADYIENLKSIKDKARKQRLLYGEWEYDSDPDSLIEYDAIVDAFDNIHVKPGPRRMTIDAAMQGSDLFRLAVWDGWRLIYHESMEKSGGREILDKVNAARAKFGVPPSSIVYDADGVGSFLGGKGGFIPGAKPFHAQARAEGGENYESMKAQCAYKLAEAINKREVWFKGVETQSDVALLTEELEQVKTRDSDKDGKLRIKRKEDIKGDIGRSPDFSDLCLMNAWFDLPRKGLPTMV